MSTKITNKKLFIEMLNSELSDDDIILLTADLEGTMKVNKKTNTKNITFGFAADAFKKKDDIGHFAFGKTPVLAFSICKREEVSDDTVKKLDEYLKSNNENTKNS